MPPRANVAVKQQPQLTVHLERRLKLVKVAAIDPVEDSPMLAAIRQYLDSLP